MSERTDIFSFFRTEKGFGIFRDLFGQFKILVVNPTVFVFAFVGLVVTADVRSGFINAAQVVVLQHVTLCMNEKEPIVTVEKDGRLVMQQIPSHEIELALAFGGIDRQCKITATLGSTKFAEACAVR